MSRIALKVIPIVMSAGLMAGCSTMPEWTKPGTWVDGVTDAGKPAESAAQKAETTPVAKPMAASTPASGDPVIAAMRCFWHALLTCLAPANHQARVALWLLRGAQSRR
jgi:hypothetical protein